MQNLMENKDIQCRKTIIWLKITKIDENCIYRCAMTQMTSIYIVHDTDNIHACRRF